MTAGPARVLVVEHQATCPPALLGGWLVEAGCVLDVRRPYAGDDLPDLERHDALLVLGGSMDAGDASVPWLARVQELVREADAGRVPVLGVCLGHQLAALALGGEVERNPRGQQVGLRDLGLDDAAGTDALLGGLAAVGAPGVFWNQDVVTLAPPGTVELARAASGELQAARFTDHVWGVQWHPEADAGVLHDWATKDADRHRTAGVDQDAVLAAVESARPALQRAGRRLAAALSDLAHERRRVRTEDA